MSVTDRGDSSPHGRGHERRHQRVDRVQGGGERHAPPETRDVGTQRAVPPKSGAPATQMSIRSATFAAGPRYTRKPRGTMPTTTSMLLT
jgi:hypothetical protein